MPSAKKVSWAQLRVGVISIAAMIIVAVLVFLITGTTTFFRENAILYTYLSDSAALTTGANVRINGILAGRVLAVELSGSTKERRVVKVTLEVFADKLGEIPVDSEAAISAENVLGSKYINIKKGKKPEHVKPGAELPSKDTSEFDEVVASGYALLVSMQGVLKRIDAIIKVVEEGKGSIGKLIYDEELYANLTKTTAEAAKVTEALNSGKGTIGRLIYDDSLHEDIRMTTAKVNLLLDDLQTGKGTAGKLLKDPALYDDLRKTVGEVRTLVADLNAGKGTAGKLLKDETLHKQIQQTIARLDTLLEKINTGQGTLGQLVVNPQMYESLNGMTREMHEFLKDFRANPKKFLHIKLGLF
ncbi:MAG: MCE family protein [Acidimicrobiia bacterium]|nr:MCE family protein [Acidimicrobiia bacterium]